MHDQISFEEFCKGVSTVPQLIPAMNRSLVEIDNSLEKAVTCFYRAARNQEPPRSLCKSYEVLEDLVQEYMNSVSNDISLTRIRSAAEGCFYVLAELQSSRALKKVRSRDLQHKNIYLEEFSMELERRNKFLSGRVQELESNNSRLEKKLHKTNALCQAFKDHIQQLQKTCDSLTAENTDLHAEMSFLTQELDKKWKRPTLRLKSFEVAFVKSDHDNGKLRLLLKKACAELELVKERNNELTILIKTKKVKYKPTHELSLLNELSCIQNEKPELALEPPPFFVSRRQIGSCCLIF